MIISSWNTLNDSPLLLLNVKKSVTVRDRSVIVVSEKWENGRWADQGNREGLPDSNKGPDGIGDQNL